LPLLYPNLPKISGEALCERTEKENAPDFLMNSAVRLFLLQHTAKLGGSEVTWKTVLAINPLPLILSPELTIYNP
jgi:hypothetical protein